MTKTIALILLTLSLVACGGEPFDAATGEPLAGAGGDATEAGSAGLAVGGSDTQVGGSSSAAGKPAGGSAGAAQGGHPSAGGGSSGGSSAGGMAGSSSAGATGGSAPVTCAFDVTALTAALPAAMVWKDFQTVSGDLCASCTYEPCAQLQVVWGKPVVQGNVVTFNPTYSPKMPTLVHVGKNDGICAEQLQCDVKPTDATVALTVTQKGDAWKVDAAQASLAFVDDDCTSKIGSAQQLTDAMAQDLAAEVRGVVQNLEFPCK